MRVAPEILQEVELCPWGCGEALLVREWFKGRPKIPIVKEKHEAHREHCPAYHAYRILIEEEVNH